MCKIEHFTYEHPKIEHYTDEQGILHEVHSYMADIDDELLSRKKDYYADKNGVMHSFYYCEHCNKHVENINRCGDYIYCSMKCASDVLHEEMKTWKLKKVHEIRMVHL